MELQKLLCIRFASYI